MDVERFRLLIRRDPLIQFAIEPLKSAWDEIIELGKMHWAETQQYRHNQPYNPRYDRYAPYANSECYIQFTARDEGKLVGFCGVYIVPSMHTQSLMATEDAWYLHPDYRRGWNAVSMFRFMEEECKRRGVVEISLTTPMGLNSGVICKRLKYTPIATVWSKRVESVSTAPTAPLSKGEPVDDERCATPA